MQSVRGWSTTMKRAAGIVAALALVAACETIDPVQEGGYRVTEALRNHQPAPLLSPIYGKALTVDGAYRIQHLALQQIYQGRPPAGFKGGLTNAAAQQQFGADGPVAGALPPGALLAPEDDGYHALLKDYRQPMVEVEVGFRFAHRITRTLPDVKSLQEHVAEILPVVELPDLQQATAGARQVDIIVANTYASRIIAGQPRAPGLTDPNAVTVTLYREGEVLNQGAGRDVLGDQWQALLWLVNRSIDSGWTIEPGQVLITGAMGRPVPLQKGLYVADFGRFGRIEWNAE